MAWLLWMPLWKPNAKSSCGFKEVQPLRWQCDREGEEQCTLVGTRESPSVCLGQRKKHRDHLWQKLLHLWCPSALNTNPPAGKDTDHKISAPPSSRECWTSLFTISVHTMLPLSLSHVQTQLLLLAAVEMLSQWVSPACEHCSAAASHPASPAWLPCKVPLPPAWGLDHLHDLAECLKQFKINLLGKKEIHLQKTSIAKTFPLLFAFLFKYW